MTTLSLRISIVKSNNVKMMQFDENVVVYDAMRIIRERVPDAAQGQANEYGLFKPDEDPVKGRWLEQGKTLGYYHFKNGDLLEYRKKMRPLRVKTLDGTQKMILVDDSQNVGELIKTCCLRIGLSNPEEFSFSLDEGSAVAAEQKTKTSTVVRDQKKLDAMKKKLHTDDELVWLNHDKSLREQGIDETQMLVLRKKFHFSDQNVDRNDPVQLNLLFHQSRDAIIDGSHPCTKDEAVQFAALQCQVQFGNHNEAKHKPGFLELQKFLPREYVKIKGIEKTIFAEHRKLHNMSELNAKFRYIQLCRSLRTYGVTFFLVKEKMKGRNRLVPRLLGITKESIMRVDENTKQVLKTWPLTTVRRWAASPNSFTLDFGDYSEAYYSVQTTEGETISQLIAGYIDIIIKKKQAVHKQIDPEDEESGISESFVGGMRADMTSFSAGGQGLGSEEGVVHHGEMMNVKQDNQLQMHQDEGAQHGVMTGSGAYREYPQGMGPMSGQLLEAQNRLKANLDAALGNCNAVLTECGSSADLPPIGTDSASVAWRQNALDVAQQNVSSAMAAILASTASIVTLTGTGDPSDINYTAAGAAVTTISTNLTELAKACRMIAALRPHEKGSDDLLNAARKLAAATANLLNASQPENLENRQELLQAAVEMGETGGNLLQLAGSCEVDKKTQEGLVIMAKAVTTATSALVNNARMVAQKCEDQALQNQVVHAAKLTAIATQALITCTKVLAPSIDSQLCQEQLMEACKLVAAAVEKIVMAAQAACGEDDAIQDLGKAARDVTEALNSLINQIRDGNSMADVNKFEEACEAILAATEMLVGSMGNAQEMVKQAKILAEATSMLVGAIRAESDGQMDPDAKRRLLDAAKNLADATSRMVEAAKGAARNPNDTAAQEALRKAAEGVRMITNATASAALKKKAIKKLEVAAKQAGAVATQCIAAAQGAGASNRNDASQQQLINHCKSVAEQISRLVQSVRTSMNNPDSASAQLGLINASQAMIPPAGKMVAAAKAAVPTVGDQAAALQLGNFAKSTASALAELRTASAKAAEVCGSLEIDSAIDVVKGLSRELAEVQKEAKDGKLLPLPGESPESCALELGATSKTVGSSMAQLLTAANQGNESYTGIAARDTASALKVLAGAVRGVAAGSKDKSTQEYVLTTARQVMDQSVGLITEAKNAVENPNQPNKQMRLAQAAKAVSQALNAVVNCLPGTRDVDQAIKSIATASQALQSKQYPDSKGEAYQVLQNNLSAAAASLNIAGSELVAGSRGTPEQLAKASTNVAAKYQELLTAGLTLAGASKDQDIQNSIVGYLRSISVASSKLLLAAKGLSADPNAPNVQNQLAAAARAVTDSINSLLNICSSTGPGQKECDNALRNIEAVAAVLDRPNEPVSDATYFDCMDTIMEKSKLLGEAGALITKHAKEGEYEKFGKAVDSTSEAVCQLTESAAQAAYLVGIADPSSSSATPGIVDQSQFARANQAISMACQSLLNPNSSQQQVLAAATVIAKHTSVLCNACKLASGKTNNPVAKKHFVQAAKDVANSTANLVKNIKALAGQLTPDNREACAQTTKPLVEAVEALTTFASSPEFASTPAKISPQAHKAQEPIISAGKGVIKASSSLLTTSKSLAINPKDAPTWQLLASHSKAISDSIKALLSAMKERCPGQKECEEAIRVVNSTINMLDQAALAALSQDLKPNASSTQQGFLEQLVECIGNVKDTVDPIKSSAKNEAEKLGHQLMAMANVFPGLAGSAIGVASKTPSSQQQNMLLEQTKTLAESAVQLLYNVQDAGGNPKATDSHHKVDESAEFVHEAVRDLTKTLEQFGGDTSWVAGMLEDIAKAMSKVDDLNNVTVEKTFVGYQTSMLQLCQSIAKHSQELTLKAASTPEDMTDICRNISNNYSELVNSTRGALATVESEDVSQKLRSNVHGVGDATTDLFHCAANAQVAPDDAQAIKDLNYASKVLAEKLSFVVAMLKAASKGTQACTEAISTINGIVGDLETTAMFAAAGALNPEDGVKGSFAPRREEILKTAKILVEDTKRLVSSAGGSQEQLAEAAHLAVNTITQEAEAVKLGATSLGSDDLEAQVLLLNAVRDVANALSNLIDTTRAASGKSVNDPSMERLKTSAKEMVTGVSTLLKTVKDVESEAGKGVRSLENAIDAIEEAVKDYDSDNPPKRDARPEDLVRSTKGVTLSTAKAVQAGSSCRQEDVTACANMGRQAIVNLLVMCKGTVTHAESPELRRKTKVAGKDCAVSYQKLLSHVHNIVKHPTYQAKQQLAELSREVAQSVSQLVHCAEDLKGSDWVNLKDPTVVAETELLNAAAAIEAAAKKLETLRPRPELKVNEDLTFEEQIVDAAMKIGSATAALVKAATAAHRELVAQGKLKVFDASSDDSQWSEGLVSAAKLVAAATSNLCDAANLVVKENAHEDKLIAGAKAVASSTAQLLMACQVKAEARSENNKRLQVAGSAVKKATESLVRAARNASQNVSFDPNVSSAGGKQPRGAVQKMKSEFDAQAEINRKERELEEAKRRLKAIRMQFRTTQPRQS